MIAIDLKRHWSWKLVLGENQWEPLFAWMLACFFNVVTPSLSAIRLFPDLISLLAVLASYWSVRPLGGRWLAFAFGWATAFNFWSFTFSRFCVREGLLFLWVLLAFGFLVRIWLRERSYSLVFLLALVLGSGFYVFTSWPLVVLVVGYLSIVKILGYPMPRERWFSLSVLVLVTGALAVPMGLERLSDGGAAHIRVLFQPSSALMQAGKYIISLFWYGFHTVPWGPDWGGFFNPILGSLVFLGFVETARRASKPLMVLMFSTFGLFLAPGALANGFSPYRISGSLPLVLLFLVLGLRELLASLPSHRTGAVFLLILAPSLFLDFHHYVDSYGQSPRSLHYLKAYEVLKAESEISGPLDVFSEFNIDYDDKTLNLACYPFDALQDPHLTRPPQMAALVVNKAYLPFLRERFPANRWFTLDPDKDPAPCPFLLILIPFASMDPGTLQEWKEADRVCRQVNTLIKNKDPGTPWSRYQDPFLQVKDRFKGDPFLTTVCWEKIAFLNSSRRTTGALCRLIKMAFKGVMLRPISISIWPSP